MKNLIKTSLVLFVMALLVLGLPGQVYAQGPTPSGDSPVVFGGDYILPAGVQVEDLVVFGGNARLEAGSTITGDVVIFGGNLDANGAIRGNVVSFGGNLRLGETAVVEGNLNSLGGSSDISPQATVRGQRITGVGNMPLRIPSRVYTPGAWVDFGPGFNFLGAVFGAPHGQTRPARQRAEPSPARISRYPSCFGFRDSDFEFPLLPEIPLTRTPLPTIV